MSFVSDYIFQLCVIAVLDWELSTLGDPILDLAYFCLPFHVPKELKDSLPFIAQGELYQ